MRTLLPFFACLMLVLTAWSGMVQAAEAAGCCDPAPSELLSHVDNGSDQGPADSDRNCPSQHAGCHGHHLGTPAADTPMRPPAFAPAPFGAGLSPMLAAHDADPALRPPQV